jgi:hypothetical protein
LTGVFQFYYTYLFFCTKLDFIFMSTDEEFFKLTYDPEFSKIFLKIKIRNIIAINKRQIYKEDLFAFSVYYKNYKEDIKEIKLKATSTREAEIWIEKLKILIDPQKYKFNLNGKKKNCISLTEYLDDDNSLTVVTNKNLLFKKFVKNPQKYFITFKNFEFIFERNKKFQFFQNFILEYQRGLTTSINNSEKIYNESDFYIMKKNSFTQPNEDIHKKISDIELTESSIKDDFLGFINTDEVTVKLKDDFLDNKFPIQGKYNYNPYSNQISVRILRSQLKYLSKGENSERIVRSHQKYLVENSERIIRSHQKYIDKNPESSNRSDNYNKSYNSKTSEKSIKFENKSTKKSLFN